MSEPDAFVIIFTIAVPVLLAVVAAFFFRLFQTPRRQRIKRTHRMRQASEQLGLRFYDTSDERILAALPECSLLKRGKLRRVCNLMRDGQWPPGVLVFDYEYTRHGRDAERNYSYVLYLVALVRFTGDVELPCCRIHRTDWFGGPVGAHDVYRLNHPQDADFNRDYMLSGRPVSAVRAMLTEPVREAVKSWRMRGPRPTVETLPGWVAAYVESDIDDTKLTGRCAELVRYAAGVAEALFVPMNGEAE